MKEAKMTPRGQSPKATSVQVILSGYDEVGNACLVTRHAMLVDGNVRQIHNPDGRAKAMRVAAAESIGAANSAVRSANADAKYFKSVVAQSRAMIKKAGGRGAGLFELRMVRDFGKLALADTEEGVALATDGLKAAQKAAEETLGQYPEFVLCEVS